MLYPEFRTEWLAFADKLVKDLDVVYNDTSISDSVKREKFAAIGSEHGMELDKLIAA